MSLRLENIHYCIEKIIQESISGDVIETGVWRGGATILMRGILKAYNIVDKFVWVAHSFEGLPPLNIDQYPKDVLSPVLNTFSELCVSLEQVQQNFAVYHLLDIQVQFLKGWFKDSISIAPIEKIALLRLDGDYYESIMDSLNALYKNFQ